MLYNLLIEIFILTQRDKILQNTLQKSHVSEKSWMLWWIYTDENEIFKWYHIQDIVKFETRFLTKTVTNNSCPYHNQLEVIKYEEFQTDEWPLTTPMASFWCYKQMRWHYAIWLSLIWPHPSCVILHQGGEYLVCFPYPTDISSRHWLGELTICCLKNPNSTYNIMFLYHTNSNVNGQTVTWHNVISWKQNSTSVKKGRCKMKQSKFLQKFF